MNKKVKLAFVLAGIGIFAAAALRCVQMLCFFDYDTGFVTDSGLLTYIYCGAAIGVSLLCMLLCRVDKKLCARIETKRNAAAGASALLMCVFLFLCAAALLRDFYLYRNNQPTYFVQASHVTTHLPFAVLTLLFAIVSLIFAIIWLTGEGFPSGTGGLWAIGSVWGISYMIVTFMTYSAVATTEENIFTVGGGAMMLLFLLPGLAYGIGAGVIKNDKDVVELMNKTISGLSSFMVLIFFAAQFTACFNYSNLGTIISVAGADFLKSVGFTGLPLIACFIVLTAFINIFIAVDSAKWAIMAPIFVPMFMRLGYSPELTQVAYRIGDSSTNIIAPLMPFFVLTVAFFQKYDKKAGIGSVISTMLPYSLAFLIGWIIMFCVWYVLGLPLGPGSPMFY